MTLGTELAAERIVVISTDTGRQEGDIIPVMYSGGREAPRVASLPPVCGLFFERLKGKGQKDEFCFKR